MILLSIQNNSFTAISAAFESHASSSTLQPHTGEQEHARAYETCGYCVSGRGQLIIDGQPRELSAGQPYLIPAGAKHRFAIVEGPFTAVEACSPLPWVHDRDRPVPPQPQQQQQQRT